MLTNESDCLLTEKKVSKRFLVSTDEFWKAHPSCTISSWVLVDWLFESFRKAISYQLIKNHTYATTWNLLWS
jgi:hypothetical protein